MNMDQDQQNLGTINIEDEMKSAYIDYSMSVIIGRALPDARDGLKPVNRRILYAMQQGGWLSNKPFIKCARVVGDVMGKYHPHGDAAIYDSLVRMAQDFSMRATLIDSQGNFGSLDGDPPAAQRYTECRMDKLAEEMLADINKETVNMRPNYDGSIMEPEVLPARVPNLLVNGSTGIAVGMATNIPPHNLHEIVDGMVHLIDHPDSNVLELMQFVKGPDFPTGAMVCGTREIQRMYETGRGHIKVRGRADIETPDKSKARIIITEIPFMVNKASMITRMAELVNEKRLEGISNIWDESNKEGIRIVIELKRGAVPDIVLNNIYKLTAMESTFGAIMLALDNNRPRVMNLKELMHCFIQHRYEVIVRRTEFELAKAKARAHILEGLIIAHDNLDEVVRIIRESKDRETARNALMSRFGLTEIQSNAILEMRLYQLTGLEREKLEQEYAEVKAEIERLETLLASDKLLFEVVKTELLEIKEKYGTERRTEITFDENEINIEDLIEDRPQVITITHANYLKRVPLDTYREQRRGGKGVKGMTTKEEDFVERVFTCSTHDTLLFFTNNGRAYAKKVYEIPEGARTSRGKAIVNLLSLTPEEKIASLVRIRDFSENEFLVFATKNGVAKKTSLSDFKNMRQSGIRAIKIDEDDTLISVKLCKEDDHLMLVTRQGMSIRFSENQLRNQGRNTQGPRGIRLSNADDAVIGLCVVNEEGTLLVASENGYGKRTEFSEYRQQSRGGKGVTTMKLTDKTGKMIGAHTVDDANALMMITAQGVMVRIGLGDIRSMGRSTQGVRLINLKEDDRLISIAPIEADHEAEPQEENSEAHEDSSNESSSSE